MGTNQFQMIFAVCLIISLIDLSNGQAELFPPVSGRKSFSLSPSSQLAPSIQSHLSVFVPRSVNVNQPVQTPAAVQRIRCGYFIPIFISFLSFYSLGSSVLDDLAMDRGISGSPTVLAFRLMYKAVSGDIQKVIPDADIDKMVLKAFELIGGHFMKPGSALTWTHFSKLLGCSVDDVSSSFDNPIDII